MITQLDEPRWRPRAESLNKFRITEGDAYAFETNGLCSEQAKSKGKS